jgi:hypothetical protein
MKNLIKFAMGAAIAGALVNLLMKQRAGAMSQEDQDFDDSVGLGDDEMAVGIETVTLSGDTVADDSGQAQPDAQREDRYGAQAGDAPMH